MLSYVSRTTRCVNMGGGGIGFKGVCRGACGPPVDPSIGTSPFNSTEAFGQVSSSRLDSELRSHNKMALALCLEKGSRKRVILWKALESPPSFRT